MTLKLLSDIGKPTTIRWTGWGEEVYVAGTFNDWVKEKMQAAQLGKYFEITVLIDRTIAHEFKFVVDDEWHCSNEYPLTEAHKAPFINNVLYAEGKSSNVLSDIGCHDQPGHETAADSGCEEATQTPVEWAEEDAAAAAAEELQAQHGDHNPVAEEDRKLSRPMKAVELGIRLSDVTNNREMTRVQGSDHGPAAAGNCKDRKRFPPMKGIGRGLVLADLCPTNAQTSPPATPAGLASKPRARPDHMHMITGPRVQPRNRGNASPNKSPVRRCTAQMCVLDPGVTHWECNIGVRYVYLGLPPRNDSARTSQNQSAMRNQGKSALRPTQNHSAARTTHNNSAASAVRGPIRPVNHSAVPTRSNSSPVRQCTSTRCVILPGVSHCPMGVPFVVGNPVPSVNDSPTPTRHNSSIRQCTSTRCVILPGVSHWDCPMGVPFVVGDPVPSVNDSPTPARHNTSMRQCTSTMCVTGPGISHWDCPMGVPVMVGPIGQQYPVASTH